MAADLVNSKPRPIDLPRRRESPVKQVVDESDTDDQIQHGDDEDSGDDDADYQVVFHGKIRYV